MPSHVHLSVDLPEQIFSLTSKGSSALHLIPDVRSDHLSATQLGTLQRIKMKIQKWVNIKGS